MRKTPLDETEASAVTHITTEHVIGTPLYMPPEYIKWGRVSDKTDTYAFGMSMYVILTGKRLAKKVRGGAEMTLNGLSFLLADRFVFCILTTAHVLPPCACTFFSV